MFLVLYKLWCFTFPLNHFGKLIWEICFSWCCYIWIESLGIGNYLAILFSLRGLNKHCFSGMLPVEALWSCVVDVVISPAVQMPCCVSQESSISLDVKSICGGVWLYRFRTAFVEVAYLFIWVKMSSICFEFYLYECRQLLKVCFIKERLVSQGMAACSQFPRLLTLLYIWIWELCILSALFRPILGKEQIP